MKVSKAELQTHLEWLKGQVAEYESKLAEPEKVGRWKPDDSFHYFYVDCDSDILNTSWEGLLTDQDRYAMGNCYQTQEQAKSARDEQLTRVKVLDRIVELNGDFNIDWTDSNQIKHFICIFQKERFSDEYCSGFSETSVKRTLHKSKYLSSRAAAQTLIDEFTAEELATVYQ